MGEKDFGQYLYTGKIFYFSKRGFPLTHTGYQQIINLQLLWMVDTDVKYTIYDEKQYRGPLQNIRVELS